MTGEHSKIERGKEEAEEPEDRRSEQRRQEGRREHRRIPITSGESDRRRGERREAK